MAPPVLIRSGQRDNYCRCRGSHRDCDLAAMDAYIDANEIQVRVTLMDRSNINQLQVNHTLFSFSVTPVGTLEGSYTLVNNSVVSSGYYVLNISVSDVVNRKAWVVIGILCGLDAPTYIGLNNFVLNAIVVNCGTVSRSP